MDNLLNGNKQVNPYIVLDEKVILQNTCPFDSLIQALCVSYCDSDLSRNEIELVLSENMVQFIKLFLSVGSKYKVYKKRAELIYNEEFFERSALINNTVVINCENNIINMLHNFKMFVSGKEVTFCSSCGQSPYIYN